MKNLLALAIIILGFSAVSFAQVSATATATTTIVTPIAISKSIDMNFGNVAVSPTLAGTVVLVPAGTRSTTGGVTLPATAGTVAAAKFIVTGVTGYTYSITLPTAPITLTGSPSGTMTAGTFTSTPSPAGVLTGGTQNILVGATLNVAAAQVAGTYTSTAFTVTVNYN